MALTAYQCSLFPDYIYVCICVLCVCVCVCVCVYIKFYRKTKKKGEMEAYAVCQQCTGCYEYDMLVSVLFDLKMSMEFNHNESAMPGFRWLVTCFSVQRPGLEPTAVSYDITSRNFGPIHRATFSSIFLLFYTLLHLILSVLS